MSCFVNNFYFMLCTLIGAIILSINIQVGLNMHLYDDIGDASPSLRGLISSFLQNIYAKHTFKSIKLTVVKSYINSLFRV